MVFRKKLMLERIKNEGNMQLVDDTVLKIMDNLDGQEVTPACWRRQVYDEPVFWCVGKDGEGMYVNEDDCE